MFGTANDEANQNKFLTNDEESSGIFDASSLFGGDGSTFVFNSQIHPVSSVAGVSFATDGSNDSLIAKATAILRSDLMVAKSEITVVSGDIADASSKRFLTLTLSGVAANADSDGFVLEGGSETVLSATDTIHLKGVDQKYVGVYTVVSINVPDKKIVVGVKLDAAYPTGALSTAGSSTVVVSDDSAARTFKTDVVEGGGLYTMKIASLRALFD